MKRSENCTRAELNLSTWQALSGVGRSEGFPERNFSSLHAMGHGCGHVETSSARRRRRRRRRHLILPGGAAASPRPSPLSRPIGLHDAHVGFIE